MDDSLDMTDKDSLGTETDSVNSESSAEQRRSDLISKTCYRSARVTRKKGKQYKGLTTLKSSNHLYYDLISYETYRLKKRSSVQESRP